VNAPEVPRVALDAAERAEVDGVISELTALGLPSSDPALLEGAALLAHELPRRIRAELVGLRLREHAAALVVRGFAVDDERLGPTPPHWRDAPDGPIGREDAYLLLIGSLLGDPFGWNTQQGGRLVHNVLPIKGHEREQVSSNSEATLSWHTEDGFCAYRPDYVGLLCLRNPDRAVTRYVDVSRLPICAHDRRLLAEPVYRIRSDYSHQPAQNPAAAASPEAFDRIGAYDERIAVLSGDPDDPVVRLDADFTDPPDQPEYADALAGLCRLVEDSLGDLVLEAGDLLVIDNFRAVHGRAPFAARFDGTDRWLKRLYVARDLRRSRPVRRGVTGRLLFE
jgi:Fe(II)/alpha-ketoglutarate-dependent arginine beta-hydroxylase